MASAILTLRTATRGDIPEIDALLSGAYPRLLKADYPPSVMVTAVPMIARARPRLVTCGTYYVVECGTAGIVGAGGWTMKSEDLGVAEMRHLVTDWRRQRQGIGRRIVEGVVEAAARRSVRRMDCLATRTAVAFYQAMGFRRLGEVELNLAPGISMPVVQMRLDL